MFSSLSQLIGLQISALRSPVCKHNFASPAGKASISLGYNIIGELEQIWGVGTNLGSWYKFVVTRESTYVVWLVARVSSLATPC